MNALLRTARPKQWTEERARVRRARRGRRARRARELGHDAVWLSSRMCLAASGDLLLERRARRRVRSRAPHQALPSDRLGRRGVAHRARPSGTLLPSRRSASPPLTGRWQTVAIVALYMLVTLTYSAIWKHIAVLDLIAIASGFVLRAAAGAVAVDVPMSNWFVLCTTFGSLFIVTGKRFAEARELGDDAERLRATLGDYSEGYLRFVLAVACGGGAGELLHVGLRAKELSGIGLPVLRALDRADAGRLPALCVGARTGPRRGAGRSVRQRPRAAGAGRDLGRSCSRWRCTRERAHVRRGLARRRRRRGMDDAGSRSRRCTTAARQAPDTWADRRDRQLPGAIDDRARQRRTRGGRGRWRSTHTPATTADRRRSAGSRTLPTPITTPSSPTWRPPASPIGSPTCGCSPTPRSERVDGDDRRAVHRRRPPLRTRSRRHPRLGRARCRRRHAADPRLVLVDRRDVGDPARAGARAEVPVRRPLPVAGRSIGPTSTRRRRDRTRCANSRSCRGSSRT